MAKNIEKAAKAVKEMEEYLNEKFPEDVDSLKIKRWENTFIYHQIEERDRGHKFTIDMHIRGMVYSMLSSKASWSRIPEGTDVDTGCIISIDKIFDNYEHPDTLKNCDSDKITDEIKKLNCASQRTRKQMKALIYNNIPQLQKICDKYGEIDNYYESIINSDGSHFKTLISILSEDGCEYKMKELGPALTAEYLRNVGYDMPKPDTHIRRILGREILGCSDSVEVPVFEAFDIVNEIAGSMGERPAKVDYILWSYCAKDFGQICTKDNPNCTECSVGKAGYCGKYLEGNFMSSL